MKFTNLLSDEAAQTELGGRLAQIRLGRGWTQAELAASAGVSKSTVERLEAGASTQLTNLLRCLRALDHLDGLERLLPAAIPGPIDLLKRHGKIRQRARPTAVPPEPSKPWAWGDEK